MQAVMLAHDAIQAGTYAVCVAGGLENMSRAPYLLTKARTGYRIGHQEMIDHMMRDGLEDAYNDWKPMGHFAEQCAEQYALSREAQDAFARESLMRARHASNTGLFATEIAPVTLSDGTTVTQDETPFKANPDKIPHLKPVFKKEGTITAANSSSISDGAAALVLMRASHAEKLGLTPLAAIRAHYTHAQDPAWFTTAPIEAIRGVVDRAGWQLSTVDCFEINEAFAVVTMAAMQTLQLPHERVNLRGGACALGHPIGASGARILVTLLHTLQQSSYKRGIASLCIGGGEATAIAVEKWT